MSKISLDEIMRNEERIIDLQAAIDKVERDMRKMPQGDFRYRTLWLVSYGYKQELKQRQEFGEQYIKAIEQEEYGK